MVLTKVEECCNPLRQNQLSHANISFWNVQLQEPFDSFLTELRSRVESCDFENRDLMTFIRDKIVFTVEGMGPFTLRSI